MGIDENKLKGLKQPVEFILSCDLEKLRHENDTKRGILWNQIKSNETTFEREFRIDLAEKEKQQIASEFTLAKLLLAAAALANSERSPIIKKFNIKELKLVTNFERFNDFDVLSVDEIADRMSRREDIYKLAMDFYQNEYAKLDEMLDTPEIQKDIKAAFNQRYRARLNKIAEGAQAYVTRYGVSSFVGQIEDKVKENYQSKSGTPNKDSASDYRRSEHEDNSKVGEDSDTKPAALDVVVTNPVTKEKKKWRLRAEWIGIILACLSVSGYLIGFQLFPYLQSKNKVQSYTLIVNAIPDDMGTIQVSPLPNSDGKYAAGTRLTLEAREVPGAHFVRWSGDAQGTIPVVVLTMDNDKQVIAEFTNTSQASTQILLLNNNQSNSSSGELRWSDVWGFDGP
jgi:hypothetical protein